MVYDTLFAQDEELNVHPQMVGEHSVSDDGLVYTFTLRDGLKWHDGDPVKAEDCVASILRWGKRDGMGQKLMDFTKELKAVDDKTFTLTLNEPYGLVLDSLGKISSNTPFMMKKVYADTDAFEQVAEALALRTENPALSPADCACLVEARHHDNAVLLTGDRRLRRVAETAGLCVHGVLWIVDELWRAGACCAARLITALQRWRDDPTVFLPPEAIERLLLRFRQS